MPFDPTLSFCTNYIHEPSPQARQPLTSPTLSDTPHPPSFISSSRGCGRMYEGSTMCASVSTDTTIWAWPWRTFWQRWKVLHTLSMYPSMHPFNVPFQCTLSMYPFNAPFQCTLSMHPFNVPFNASFQCTLSMYPFNRPFNVPFQYTLSMYPFNVPFQ